jgi:hypothetical protein
MNNTLYSFLHTYLLLCMKHTIHFFDHFRILSPIFKDRLQKNVTYKQVQNLGDFTVTCSKGICGIFVPIWASNPPFLFSWDVQATVYSVGPYLNLVTYRVPKYWHSGIWLLYRPANLCSMAGRYDNPMPESTISPSQDLRIWEQLSP